MLRIKPYARLALDAVRSNFVRLGKPYRLIFCLTYWCNYRCETCNIWKLRPKDELSFDEVRQFFEKNSQFSWIDLSGGEVWLRNDFVEICLRGTRFPVI